jgi:glycosyltransferase involved in cell wall biosynthesis
VSRDLPTKPVPAPAAATAPGCRPASLGNDPGSCPSLTILIPAYNEEKRIRATLELYARHFQQFYHGKFYLLVVLNGCRDRTLDVVREASLEFPQIRWVEFKAPIGKGGALIDGFKEAEGTDLVGFTDADASTTPASFLRLARECAKADCAIGSRRISGAVIRQFQPSHRMFASGVFHAIVEVLFRMGIKDTQCGAKVLRSEALQRIHPTLHIADMAFDINLLYSLKRANLRILEIPVEWTDSAGSSVRYFRTSLVMFLSVVRLRLIYSPFYRWLRPLRPLEGWIYRSLLRNPPPRQVATHEPVSAAEPSRVQ